MRQEVQFTIEITVDADATLSQQAMSALAANIGDAILGAPSSSLFAPVSYEVKAIREEGEIYAE